MVCRRIGKTGIGSSSRADYRKESPAESSHPRLKLTGVRSSHHSGRVLELTQEAHIVRLSALFLFIIAKNCRRYFGAQIILIQESMNKGIR